MACRPGRHGRITPELLEKMLGIMDSKEISLATGYAQRSIRTMAYQNGLHMVHRAESSAKGRTYIQKGALEIPREKLMELYWDKGLSTVDIARMYKTRTTLVCRRLRHHRIPKRTRSESHSISKLRRKGREEKAMERLAELREKYLGG